VLSSTAAGRTRWTRRDLGRAVALSLGAAQLTSCTPLLPRRSDSDPPRLPIDNGYQLRPVDEALWVCQEDGTLWALDARTDTVTARLPLGLTLPKLSAPTLFAGSVIWAYEFQTGAIVTVEPRAVRITGRATVPGAANLVGLATLASHGALWVAHHGSVWRIGPDAGVTSIPLPADFAPRRAVDSSRWLWLAADRRLARVDAVGHEPVHVVDLPADLSVGDLVAGPDAMYAISADALRIWLLDPQTGRVRSELSVGEAVSAIFPIGSDLWIAGLGRTIYRVRGGNVEAFTVLPDGLTMDSIALFSDSLWLCVIDTDEVFGVDLATATVTARVPIEVADPDDPNFGVYAGERTLWVLDGDFFNGISRIDPLTGRARKVVPATGITFESVVAAPAPVAPSTLKASAAA
jgi:hypothetical protein